MQLLPLRQRSDATRRTKSEAGSRVTSCPSTDTLPRAAGTRLITARASVDLPAPLGPITPINANALAEFARTPGCKTCRRLGWWGCVEQHAHLALKRNVEQRFGTSAHGAGMRQFREICQVIGTRWQ